MSVNTSQVRSQAFRALTDADAQAALLRLGGHAIGLAKELANLVSLYRGLR